MKGGGEMVTRLERGESFVVFVFSGDDCAMRNSLLERASLSADEAHERIANLRCAGWVDCDA
jgi:hypothetical protein